KHNKNWKFILYAHIAQGLREGIFLFVITIWVFLITRSEFSLGIFNVLLYSFSFIFYLMATKFIKPKMRKQAILLGAFILYASIYIFLFNLTYFIVLIYAVFIGLSNYIIYLLYISH